MLHSSSSPPRRHARIRLRILGTTDLHVHLLPFDYTTDRRCETVGLSRTAGLIAAMRKRAANVLLFDNGDFLQGSPLGDLIVRDGLRDGAVHPIIAAMNALGYDAGTLGNHEFSHGLPFLRRSVRDAAFPLVSANAEGLDGAPVVAPHALLDRSLRAEDGSEHRVRIGVIGFLPPQTAVWDREHLSGQVRTPEILAAAARHLPDLRAQADLVVALCHSGIEAAGASGSENAATALAARPEVDVILAGHTHLVFPGGAHAGLSGVDARRGTLHGKPAVMAGAFGSHLGVIDLSLDREGGSPLRITAARSRAVPVWRRGPDGTPAARVHERRAIRQLAETTHRATRAMLAEPLGHTEVALDSHYMLAGDNAANYVIAASKREAVRAALADTALAALPLLATASAFKTGGRGGPANFASVAPGPLTLRNIADIYPFPNTIAALRMTGARLVRWLERAATVYRTILPGVADQPLIDEAVPGYRFFGVLGAEYAIDLAAAPMAGRIRDLRIGGAPVDPAAEVVVATSSYRAALFGAEEDAGAGGKAVHAAAQDCRDIVADWVRAQAVIAEVPYPGWRLLLPPGASVTLDTAPDARTGRDLAPGLFSEPVGVTDDGFLRVRLTAAG